MTKDGKLGEYSRGPVSGLLDGLTAAERGLLGSAPAAFVTPMLATLTDRRFSDPDWIFERKLDGVRAVAVRDAEGRVALVPFREADGRHLSGAGRRPRRPRTQWHRAGRRPLVLHRFPDGIDDAGFYQKQAPQGAPTDTVTVAAQNTRGHVEHLLIDDVEGLRYLANQAVVELHRWLCHADDLDHPDLLVIDLDPPRRDLTMLRRAVRATRDLLGEIGLCPHLMTTGGRGYHIVAPLDATSGFDDVRALARAVATRLAADAPDELTTEQRTAKRGNRIYLDTARNAYAQTTVVPYSPRARPGAPVAVPIDFAELGRVEPHGYDTTSVLRRLACKPDPWTDIATHAGSAERARTDPPPRHPPPLRAAPG